MPRERLGILGLGLIGGSLALALKGKRGAPEVWGCDRNRSHVRQALAAGAIARGCTERELAGCDIIAVCIPVQAALSAIRSLGARMRPGSILTDAGSVKRDIVREGERLAERGVLFVGGHPIAGTERSGFRSADPSLFRGRPFIATPTRRTTTRRLSGGWSGSGALPDRTSSCGWIRGPTTASSPPYPIFRTSLRMPSCTPLRPSLPPVPLGYSAGGFRDFTRIASSNPEMWKDIVLMNRAEILRAVAHYRRNLDLLERRIAAADSAGIRKFFERAKKTRDGLETP